MAKVHSPSSAVPGQTVTFTVTVTNVGTSPSSGTVTVTETPPAGLTITALSGTGWTCTVATRTCTRSDALAPAASYPEITVTTTVGASVAPGTVTNSAVVSGGGDSNPGNNTASDPTTITSPVVRNRPHHCEGAQPEHRPPRADRHVHRDGHKRRELAVERHGDRDRDAAGGPDDYGALRHRLDLHRRHTDLHSKRRARPDGELPRHHGDDECRRQCGAWHADEQRSRLRRRRFELANNTASSPVTVGPAPVPVLPVSFVIGLMSALLAIALSALRARRQRPWTRS